MIRQHIPLSPDGFRVRGVQPSRLEAFSDAVFAFAVTLLVVSLDVPRTFTELKALTAGFLGFAFSFAMIVMLWRIHTRFFSRYGLDDKMTLWLNSVLLFLVLFFVYPLKFLFTLVSSFFVGEAALGGVRPMSPGDGPELMLLYGGGFFAVFAVFALMHVHALRRAEALDLSAEERALTRNDVESYLLVAFVGLLSIGVAYLPMPFAPLSGFVYFLIFPTLWLHERFAGRRRLAALRAQETPEPEAVEVPEVGEAVLEEASEERPVSA